MHKNIPASVIVEIINLFIVIRLNAKRIQTKLNKNISYNTICSILVNMRKCIANYIKHKYRCEQIGGDPSENKIVAIDESLFLHDGTGRQIWVVGAVDTNTKQI